MKTIQQKIKSTQLGKTGLALVLMTLMSASAWSAVAPSGTCSVSGGFEADYDAMPATQQTCDQVANDFKKYNSWVSTFTGSFRSSTGRCKFTLKASKFTKDEAECKAGVARLTEILTQWRMQMPIDFNTRFTPTSAGAKT